MCDTNAFLLKDGVEEPVLENVDRVEFKNGEILLINIFGERKTLRARPAFFDNSGGKLIFEPLDE